MGEEVLSGFGKIPAMEHIFKKLGGLDPSVRRMIFKDAAQGLALVATLDAMFLYGITSMGNAALKRMGVEIDAETYLNPLHPRFGQIRVESAQTGAGVSFDTTAGMANALRFMAWMYKGERISPRSGARTDINRWEYMGRYLWSKMNPSMGTSVAALKGQTYIGDPFNPEDFAQDPLQGGKAAVSLFSPIIFEELWDSWHEAGGGALGFMASAGTGAASFLGVSSTAFRTRIDVLDAVTREYYPNLTKYDEANDSQRAQIENDYRVRQHSIDNPRTSNKTEQQKVRAQQTAYGQVVDSNNLVLSQELEMFTVPGRPMRESIKNYKRKQVEGAKVFLNKEQDQVLHGVRPAPLLDQLRDWYFGITAEIDPVTGEPNFITFHMDRSVVLDVARSMGFTEAEMKAKSGRYSDEYPGIERWVKEYEQDMEILGPYFALGVGMPEKQKRMLREGYIRRDHRILPLLYKWDYKLLPGQTKYNERLRMQQERMYMGAGPTITEQDILQSIQR